MNTAPAGLLNLRDVSTHTPIAPGVLLRSDAPQSHTGPGAPQTRHTWPPASVVDLRAIGEGEANHPLHDVSELVAIELFDSLAPTSFTMPTSLLDLYTAMLEPPVAARVVAAVTTVATAPAPVLVHCTAGKDRTGVVVALALALAGVSREDIVTDYAATAAAMPSLLERWSTTGAMPAASEQVPAELFTAPTRVMSGFLDRLDEQYGDAQEWFFVNGGDASVPDALASRFGLLPGR